jgi:thiol-disulfide isomerase/thioredoxin
MKILKFGAKWCSGCVIMKPRFYKLEEAYKANNCPLDSEFYDVDDEDGKTVELVAKFKVMEDKSKIPQFIFINDKGEEVERLIGEVETDILVQTIDSLLIAEGITPPTQRIKNKPWWQIW